MYKYWGFGLHIFSEIEFPELMPGDFEIADVTITLGTTPEKLEGEVVTKKAFSSLNKDEYLLRLSKVGTYYASYGNKIVVQPLPGVDEHSIRLFLLGTIMAAIIYQRGNIPLHAAAIIKNGKLILFAGNSGAGKSTLLATCATKGYEIFTDDICIVQQAPNDTIVGTASYPMLKLWDDAINKLDSDRFNRDFKVRPKLPKYGQFFYHDFNTLSLPIAKVFILFPWDNEDAISVNRLVTIAAFKELQKHAYKGQLISDTKLRGLYFSLLGQMTNHIPISLVRRPLHGSNVEALFDELEKHFDD
jgi:hypothetical protein